MTYTNNKFSIIISLLALLILGGCQSVDVRGQFVSDKAVNEINTKKPTKDEVVNLIGTPTYVPDYTENTWYYIQRSMSRRAWFTPKVDTQRIIKITFNSNNRVLEVALLTGIQNEEISAERKLTKTPGTEKTGFQKFVKNIGRFNKTTTGTNRRKKKR